VTVDSPRLLVRATELSGMPVVSIAEGEALADVKDVLYDPEQGQLLGFTLNKRGFLRGPMKAVLPMSGVGAIGRHAVMVDDAEACAEKGSELAAEARSSSGRNVIGDDVLTDGGRRLGKVVDIVVAADSGDVLGYELEPDPSLASGGATRFLPIPDTLAVSGSALVVPTEVEPFIRDDLSGFGAAVEEFRAQLGGTGS